jgi:hypothetical protein
MRGLGTDNRLGKVDRGVLAKNRRRGKILPLIEVGGLVIGNRDGQEAGCCPGVLGDKRTR